jgi:hypothetical protein
MLGLSHDRDATPDWRTEAWSLDMLALTFGPWCRGQQVQHGLPTLRRCGHTSPPAELVYGIMNT